MNTIKTRLLGFAIALAYLSVPSICAAQGVLGERMKAADRKAMQQRFVSTDLDRSGGISHAELKKTPKQTFPNLKKNFRAMDANRDGEVSLNERDAWVSRQAKTKR